MNEMNPCKVWVEPMTREEFMGKGKPLTINYSIQTAPFGRVLVASTAKGICLLMPAAMKWEPVQTLKRHFPKARIRYRAVALHKKALLLLRHRHEKVHQLCLHLYGTPFQIEVWRDLLDIPVGMVTTYQNIANRIGRPKSARPVGQAVGANPVMCLVPCHRVVRTNGTLGGYRWDVSRKIKLLNQEAQQSSKDQGHISWEPTLF
ncbi:MAG: methylated-DNA--[protein]-cysteine S-methyltransferase [Bacteroidales bacterium]|nr:methylated-DNA--[protein]-cysteine S-methyltransferase [Bacteroidales bacterium]